MTSITSYAAAAAFVVAAWCSPAAGADVQNPQWTAPHQFRVLLSVDPRGRTRSRSPAAVEIDFPALLGRDRAGSFDPDTLEVVALDGEGRPKVFDASREGRERFRVPHRIDPLYGSTKATLNFVMPDQTCTRFAVYFDTAKSGLAQPGRFAGLIGDGDWFRQGRGKREIGGCHFDQFVDFDGDGDLDLFKGGVEPYVYCYENVGGQRLVDRGRLSSAGDVLKLPCSDDDRSWLTVALADWDGDGEVDLLPSFNDGPDRGTIVLYRNATRENGGQSTFTRIGPLKTASGALVAGGAQAGGWFPSITPVDWDGDGKLDALVGSNNRCYLYSGLGTDDDGLPQLADAVEIQSDGQPLVLVNPRFDCADADGDGDLDLFAGTQPGPIHMFRNVGSRQQPLLAKGEIVAYRGKYLIGDAHSGVKVADFNGDKLPDLLVGRFWERTDLDDVNGPRDFGGLRANIGTRAAAKFERSAAGSPYTEQFQPCDCVRQNCVRAVDWDQDGKLDLLAGDTDGFIWLFHNETGGQFSAFAEGQKLLADGKPLCLSTSGGHARMDVCDWNNDGTRDLVVADGGGTLTLFLGRGGRSSPALAAGVKLSADGRPVQGQSRASALVCDWDQDGKKDVVFADSDGYWLYKNIGADAQPVLAAAQPIRFGGATVGYVRPNLGSLVDWDGDGRKDFIGCNFENFIFAYKNLGSGRSGDAPRFDSPEGVTIVRASSPQMISGADAVDFSGDGDLDILTGQGHGGSGLRFYERDWIEDQQHGTHPRVTAGPLQSKPTGANSP